MKICTWGDVASAIEGKTSGGGELQIALLAKALAKSGHEVAVIDIMAKKDFVTNDNVKIFQIKGYDKGIRVLRFFTQRLPKLYKSLKDQKADIYYCQILFTINGILCMVFIQEVNTIWNTNDDNQRS